MTFLTVLGFPYSLLESKYSVTEVRDPIFLRCAMVSPSRGGLPSVPRALLQFPAGDALWPLANHAHVPHAGADVAGVLPEDSSSLSSSLYVEMPFTDSFQFGSDVGCLKLSS